MARIEHVNVAQGEDDGVFYLVVEWIDGPSLATLCWRAEREAVIGRTALPSTAVRPAPTA